LHLIAPDCTKLHQIAPDGTGLRPDQKRMMIAHERKILPVTSVASRPVPGALDGVDFSRRTVNYQILKDEIVNVLRVRNSRRWGHGQAGGFYHGRETDS
jgi:hypothetical protein